MNNDKVKALCKHLEQEISWVESLNNLLAEEKGFLETRQFAQMEECASKKQDLSNKLEDSAKQRMELINSSNQAINAADALNAFLKECPEAEINQVKTLNNKLAHALTRCRELNAVNGQVIANNLYVRQELVNALSGNKPDAVKVYNAHGNLSSSNDTNRHHEEA
ncbi:flagella synthesis protein FlgN [Legionella saoudiensis]|uniref:flagella synthesis protein FlgN n=1 Tax=Legionella saoudiensis TaxID=1750561 RepID=UPI0007309D93|nr:flagellar protein FlgN [Legionella saoudiensis]